jgi:hypothetical protein
MEYLSTCLKKFGLVNFITRWLELIFSVLGISSYRTSDHLIKVLVLGGVVPYEKLTGFNSPALQQYSGIYDNAGATRFTIFAVITYYGKQLIPGSFRDRLCLSHPSNCFDQMATSRLVLFVHSDSRHSLLGVFPGFVHSTAMR